MADASNLQVSFLGGEIAPSYQGRADQVKYKIGMNKCFNSMPLETGAWARRPGTRVAAPTRAGKFAKIIDFDFSQNAPFTAEFTDSHLRFFSTYSLIHTFDPKNVLSISTASPAVVTVAANSWSDGDMVEFFFPTVALTPEQGALLQGRQFVIGSSGGTTFTLFDSVTNAPIDGSTLNFTAGTPCIVQRILDIPTTYSAGMVADIRGVQALNGATNTLVLLHSQITPQALTSTAPPAPTFALNPATFQDGPYLDPVTDGTTITPGAASGSTSLVSSTPKFAITDIGRSIRLFSQPAAWASGTTYAQNALVTYQDAFYVSLVGGNTGKIPGTDATNWAVAANAVAWVWAVITAFTNSTTVTATLKVVNTPTLKLPGVLVNTNAITLWRFGAFSDTSGYPTCGTYTEGRLFLSGVIGNRFDASVSGDIFNFSPTAVDGTVADNNAISYTFNAKDINTIFWMAPQEKGVLCGTQAAEWLIQASSNGDVLTPTSIQAKRITKYGSANVEPVDAPFATLFVARNNKKLFEYLADMYSGRFSGINVGLTGSHLATTGIAEVRYQKELTPVAWARMNDGSLAGMTYRRESPVLSQEPTFSGWHSHTLGTNRTVVSIAIGPSVGGDLDALSMVTYDQTANIYYVELLTDLFPDNGKNTDAWFVDGGVTPAGALLTGSGASATNLRIYGLQYFNGQTVSAYIAGIDAGDFVVANGVIDIALPGGYNGSKLLTGVSIAAASGVTGFSPIVMPVAFPIPNFPANPQSIQSYIGPTTPVTGTQGDTVLIDALNYRMFNFKQGNGATDGMRAFDIMSGNQIAAATSNDVWGPAGQGVTAPYSLGYDGFIYTVNGTPNMAEYVKIDPTTLRIVDRCGQNSSSLTISYTHIWFPGNIAPISTADGNNFLLCPALSNGPQTVSLINVNGSRHAAIPAKKGYISINGRLGLGDTAQAAGSMQNAGFMVTMTDVSARSCSGPAGSGLGYTLGYGSGADTNGLNLYKTTVAVGAAGFNCPTTYGPARPQVNPFVTFAQVGSTITVANIDATWTNISTNSGPILDNSDGNILVFVGTINPGPTNKDYLIKISATTGAILWKTAVNTPAIRGGLVGPNTYVSFFNFCFASSQSGPTYKFNQVNTSTGAITQTTLLGLVPGPGIWDSRIGALFTYCTYLNGAGAPTPLGNTPNSFGNWGALFGLGPTLSTGRQFYLIPACVGTTFTSQGQRLRPLEPAETGARNGPALGKTRRNHRAAFTLLNAAGMKMGTLFTKLKALLFKTAGGTAYPDNQLYSGVYSDTVVDDYSYDGMIGWQITRPYPATVLSSEGFIETQDR